MTALSTDGFGYPATLHLQNKVVSCDPAKPSISLANGQTVEGDLVIGADGVHVSLEVIDDRMIINIVLV